MSNGAHDLVEFDLPLDQLVEYAPERVEPPDFDVFWTETLEDAAQRPLAAELTPVTTPLTTLEVFDVRFDGWGGDPVHGWLLRDPRDPHPGSCVIQFIGYGGGRGHPFDHLMWPSAGHATLVMDTRGQGVRTLRGATGDPHASHPHVPGWLTRGIRDPATYYYRRVFVDAVRAVEVARTHPAIAADRVAVVGTSQGGGVAIAAAALTQVDAVVANLPFGSHYQRAIRITHEAPYSEIATYLRLYRHEAETVLRTMSYFDGMNLAARASAPALFSVGLMDRVSPPSTVFAAYHQYGGERQIRVWPFNGHEGGETDQDVESVAFVNAVLAVEAPPVLAQRT